MKPRTAVLTAILLAVPLTGLSPAEAATRCVKQFPVDATVAVVEIGPVGTAMACSPSFGFGGSFTVEVTISGIGIVGAQINGPFDRVECGPAVTVCHATSPVFSSADGPVICSSRTTLAVRVEMICDPDEVT